MAAITVLTKFATAPDNQSYNGQGIKAFTQAYAATSIPALKTGAKEQHVCYAQLTGAMTINLATVVAQLQQFDIVYFHFNADAGGARVVTWGTNIIAPAATLSVTASKDATAVGIFDGTNLKIFATAVGA